MTSDDSQFAPPPTADQVVDTTAPTAPTTVPAVEPAPATATETSTPVVVATAAPSTKSIRVLSVIVMIAGLILVVAGVVTWFVVGDQLSQEKIVVSSDAENFAGEKVEGPFTAYAEAEAIHQHALEAGNGKTYAELPQDDPARDTVMTASFLRASLFTSVVSFGVAAFAAGMGLLMIVVGYVLHRLGKVTAELGRSVTAVAATT